MKSTKLDKGNESVIIFHSQIAARCLEIPIETMVGKWKVSQNRSATDRRGVARGLEEDDRDAALAKIKVAAESSDNLLYPMKEALQAKATIGEVCNALRAVWGVYTPSDAAGS